MSICIIILHNCERYGLNLQVESKFTRQSLEIDGLRAICALVVVFGHSGMSFISAQTGVTFFLISGYVITLTLLNEFIFTSTFSIKKFMLRRFFKLFPPLMGIVILPSYLFFNSLKQSAEAIASQIFLL